MGFQIGLATAREIPAVCFHLESEFEQVGDRDTSNGNSFQHDKSATKVADRWNEDPQQQETDGNAGQPEHVS